MAGTIWIKYSQSSTTNYSSWMKATSQTFTAGQTRSYTVNPPNAIKIDSATLNAVYIDVVVTGTGSVNGGTIYGSGSNSPTIHTMTTNEPGGWVYVTKNTINSSYTFQVKLPVAGTYTIYYTIGFGYIVPTPPEQYDTIQFSLAKQYAALYKHITQWNNATYAGKPAQNEKIDYRWIDTNTQLFGTKQDTIINVTTATAIYPVLSNGVTRCVY